MPIPPKAARSIFDIRQKNNALLDYAKMRRLLVTVLIFLFIGLTPVLGGVSPSALESLSSRDRVLLVFNQRAWGLAHQNLTELDHQLEKLRDGRRGGGAPPQESPWQLLHFQRVALVLSLFQATGDAAHLREARQTVEKMRDFFDRSPEFATLKAAVDYFDSAGGLPSKKTTETFAAFLRRSTHWAEKLELAWMGLLLGDDAFDRSAWAEAMGYYEPLARSRLRSAQVGELAVLRLSSTYRKLSRFSEAESLLLGLVFREGDDRISQAAARELARTSTRWRDPSSVDEFYRKTFEQDSIDSLKIASFGRVFLETAQSTLLSRFDERLKKRAVRVAEQVLSQLETGFTAQNIESLIQVMDIISRLPDAASEIARSVEARAKAVHSQLRGRTRVERKERFGKDFLSSLTRRLFAARFRLTYEMRFRAQLVSDWVEFCQRSPERACSASLWDTTTSSMDFWNHASPILKDQVREIHLRSLREIASRRDWPAALPGALEDCLAHCQNSAIAARAGREWAEFLFTKKDWVAATKVMNQVLHREPRLIHWVFYQRIQWASGLTHQVFLRPESLGVALVDCGPVCNDPELSEIRFQAARKLAQAAVDRDDLEEAGLQFSRMEHEGATRDSKHLARDLWFRFLVESRHWEDALRKWGEFPTEWRSRPESRALLEKLGEGLLSTGSYEWSRDYLQLFEANDRTRSNVTVLLGLLSGQQPALSELDAPMVAGYLDSFSREIILECHSRIHSQSTLSLLSRIRRRSKREEQLFLRLKSPPEGPRLERFELFEQQIQLLRERQNSPGSDVEFSRQINLLILRLERHLLERKQQAQSEYEKESLKPIKNPNFMLPEGWDRSGSPLEPVAWLWAQGNPWGACVELERRRAILRPSDYWRTKIWWLSSIQGTPGARTQSPELLAELFATLSRLSTEIPTLAEVLRVLRQSSPQ